MSANRILSPFPKGDRESPESGLKSLQIALNGECKHRQSAFAVVVSDNSPARDQYVLLPPRSLNPNSDVGVETQNVAVLKHINAPTLVPQFLPCLGRMKSFVRDLDGTIRFWNQGVARLYGWTIQEAVGQQCYRLLHTRFPKPLSEIEAELLNTGSWHGELHHRSRDGRELIILSNWALHCDRDGTPASVTETNYELTDLNQTRLDLKSSQQESNHRLIELDVLYRTAQVGLGFLDQELRYVRLNDALAEINQLSVEAHLGRYASEINPGLAKIIMPMMEQVLVSRQPLLNIEITGSPSPGVIKQRTWMVNFHPVSNGETFGVSVVFQDITVLKETEDIRTRFGVIVESSADAMISMKLDGAITSWNPAAERLFGYSAAEVLGKAISILAPLDQPDELPDILNRLQQGERAVCYERSHQRKDGRYVDVSLTVSPILDHEGCVIGASETMRDVTKQNRAQAVLLQKNEELRQFAFAAAHDLQEPLRNVGLSAQMLDAGFKLSLDEAAHESLTNIIESARRMQTLIKDLLAYTEAVEFPGKQGELVDCNEACRTALDNLTSAVEECGAAVSIALLPTVLAERFHLIQLFQNLVSNALKYRARERSAQIHVSAERHSRYWVFSVQDNSIGIAPEYHDRIFGVFKRLHGRDVPGTGIGLAICKRIVEHHGGRLWLESEVGVGSIFFFSIPICD